MGATTYGERPDRTGTITADKLKVLFMQMQQRFSEGPLSFGRPICG
jgi:hypothetical protein